MLVQAIHKCALRFPEVAGTVIYLLMDFLSDSTNASSADVAFFIREIAFTNKALRPGIIEHLLDVFSTIRSSRVCATTLWIIGEFSTTNQEIEAALDVMRMSLGSAPLLEEKKAEEEDEEAATSNEGAVRPAVLADGTYASQAATYPTGAISQLPNVREMLLKGDSFLSAVIASTLTKLALKVLNDDSFKEETKNAIQAECMLYM
jgi:Adaptin N terminal region.